MLPVRVVLTFRLAFKFVSFGIFVLVRDALASFFLCMHGVVLGFLVSRLF